MKMGMVHTLTWAASTTVNCPNTLIFDLTDELAAADVVFAGWATEETTGKKILVLPKAATGVSTCEIGNEEIEFDATAFSASSTLPTCTDSSCWEWESDAIVAHATGSNVPASGQEWIRKTGSKYVFHDIP